MSLLAVQLEVTCLLVQRKVTKRELTCLVQPITSKHAIFSTNKEQKRFIFNQLKPKPFLLIAGNSLIIFTLKALCFLHHLNKYSSVSFSPLSYSLVTSWFVSLAMTLKHALRHIYDVCRDKGKSQALFAHMSYNLVV